MRIFSGRSLFPSNIIIHNKSFGSLLLTDTPHNRLYNFIMYCISIVATYKYKKTYLFEKFRYEYKKLQAVRCLT